MLEGNQITDLTPLTGLKSMFYLDLGENQIADLTPLAGLPILGVLRLDGNQITDLKPLASLLSLSYLDLSDNPNLTKAEINKLQKIFPSCKIIHNATK